MIKAKKTLEGKLNVSIVKEYPELENITITPMLEEQNLKSDKYGFGNVKVEAIPATDIEIIPTTEEQVKTGIFKEVTVNAIKENILDITPTEQAQSKTGVYTEVNVGAIQTEEISTDLDFSNSNKIELTPQDGKYIKKVTINKDVNLSPENIKSGISIDGIEGNLADTGDADATADDILLNKTAYVANTMLRGTFKPLDTSDATATASDIAKNKTAYVNGEKVTGTLENYNTEMNTSFGGQTTSKSVYCLGFVESIKKIDYVINVPGNTAQNLLYGAKGLQYIKGININNATNCSSMFNQCQSLVEAPELDLSRVTGTCSQLFYGCTNLEKVPDYNISGVTSLNNAFSSCSKLSDESLNNIMATCITGVKVSTKTLKIIGLSQDQATRCQSLSNYQALLDAGWTTGY